MSVWEKVPTHSWGPAARLLLSARQSAGGINNMQTRASAGARRPVHFDETPVNWSHHGSEDDQSTGKNTPPDTAGTIPAQSRSPATDSHAGDRESPDPATENLNEARDGSMRWTSSADEYRRTPPKTWSTEQVAKFMCFTERACGTRAGCSSVASSSARRSAPATRRG